MPEVSINVIVKSNDEDVCEFLEGINVYLSQDVFRSLAKAYKGKEYYIENSLDGTSISRTKLAKGLFRLDLNGDGSIEFLNALHKLDQCVFWSFLSHEHGYDIYAFNDGAGFWCNTVSWDGSSDPEEDRKEAEIEWLASMTKVVLKQFVDDVEDALERVKEYKANKKTQNPWSDYLTKHVDRDGLILKLRIKAKGDRLPLFRKLKAYIDNPDADFEDLVEYFTNRKVAYLESDNGARYPNWSDKMKAPLELAQGIMFVEESGNYLYVGFQMENIRPYMEGDCNSSPQGNYAINLVHYFRVLADSVNGRAIHKVSGEYMLYDIVEFSGHLYVE